MIKIAIAGIAIAASLGLTGVVAPPAAQAGTCYGNGTACVKDPKYAPSPERRREAAKRATDQINKDIADKVKKIKKALGCD